VLESQCIEILEDEFRGQKAPKNVWDYIMAKEAPSDSKASSNHDEHSKSSKEKSNAPAKGTLNGEYFHYSISGSNSKEVEADNNKQNLPIIKLQVFLQPLKIGGKRFSMTTIRDMSQWLEIEN